ncbi:hypothetical protein BJ878DRAFT_574496 [Calycina marina]|uniref:Autophagy protein n=1 Tax=Calycina marina TaxID=1763456 RepID=A0A9P8CG48_9HELO|nr:hypothetical protein BJ878DRAFT_574496 [Calycina marina]
MGWLWGSSGDDGSKKDAFEDLDPSLRDFLKKESPVKYETAPAKAPTPTTPAPAPQQETPNPDGSSKPKVPPQSLFQDGRYAEYWQGYRPLRDIEDEVKTDQEKITDVIEGYKYRKSEIGRAALENCALEQWDVSECFKHGGWTSRMTMCRAENRKFDRCFMMQSKFLKALGYLSLLDRAQEVDEEIQMHADTLYHRMLDQEKQIEEAESEGRPVPVFPPLVASIKKSKASGPTATAIAQAEKPLSDLSPENQAVFQKRIEGLDPEERELEERAFKAELETGKELATAYVSIMAKQDAEREQRKKEGKETIGDKLTAAFRVRPTYNKPAEDRSNPKKLGANGEDSQETVD